jgi:hypothetical protein
MNKRKQVEKYLMAYGTITSLEIQQMYFTTCPHGIIRDLREKHGYNAIDDIWIKKTEEVVEDGKKRKETSRHKKYIWKGAA